MFYECFTITNARCFRIFVGVLLGFMLWAYLMGAQTTGGVQRHTRRRKVRYGNPQGTKI